MLVAQDISSRAFFVSRWRADEVAKLWDQETTNSRKTRRKNEQTPDDILLSYESLALRWDLSVIVVRRRVRASNIPIIRISYSTVRVRLSDVLKFEAASVAQEPSEYQSSLTDSMHKILAARKAARAEGKAEVASK